MLHPAQSLSFGTAKSSLSPLCAAVVLVDAWNGMTFTLDVDLPADQDSEITVEIDTDSPSNMALSLSSASSTAIADFYQTLGTAPATPFQVPMTHLSALPPTPHCPCLPSPPTQVQG